MEEWEGGFVVRGQAKPAHEMRHTHTSPLHQLVSIYRKMMQMDRRKTYITAALPTHFHSALEKKPPHARDHRSSRNPVPA
jgi:hypothetical protein